MASQKAQAGKAELAEVQQRAATCRKGEPPMGDRLRQIV